MKGGFAGIDKTGSTRWTWGEGHMRHTCADGMRLEVPNGAFRTARREGGEDGAREEVVPRNMVVRA